MRVDVFFTVAHAEPALLQEATVVVIDAVRATTSMVEALANGARGIFPTASTEEAVKLAVSLGRDDTLLCGERKGVKIEGFDLGNSPGEFTAEVVAGKRLVMSTTNGTGAFAAAQEAPRLVACAFTNLSAVATALAANDGTEHLVVLCAGRQGRFALEDALCAGHLLRKVLDQGGPEADLNDGARAALTLAGALEPTLDFLQGTAAGRALEEIDLADDLVVCAELDRHAVVPEMMDQALTAKGG
ncbi:MAG: 2-phosphosulfolactate phosphatase [Gemmatimonadetes bacterium]|nr:2-phosphosulfolactate phosphatase [Gemmatimonadota bacterium]